MKTKGHAGLIYLATPYSHPDPMIVEVRFNAINRIAADLMGRGVYVFSPISHTHPIAMAGDLPTSFEYWREYCTATLQMCAGMIIAMSPGWMKSKGVAGETAIAQARGMWIEYAPMFGTHKYRAWLKTWGTIPERKSICH